MFMLLLNAGSSSLKATLLNASDGETVASGHADWAGNATHYHFRIVNGASIDRDVDWKGHDQAVDEFVRDLRSSDLLKMTDAAEPLMAVGHRIVHGGHFTQAVRIKDDVLSEIESLSDLAPLHNPPSIRAMQVGRAAFPDVPHVAVFDTAFHSTMLPEAYTYAIPAQWTQEWGIRKYGFHGLSHAYCCRRAAQMLGKAVSELRMVICHLGNGCSATAVAGGVSVDTTMGFTPLDGLVMGTRSGSIDPAIVTYVQQHRGMSAEQADYSLNHDSGLRGVSGVSSDMREVLAAAETGNDSAGLAIDIYTLRIRKTIGSFAAIMGGLDALVFTAGVGENSPKIRAQVCEGMSFLGIELDADANQKAKPDIDVSAKTATVQTLVIATREELTMWQEVLNALSSGM